MNHRRLEGKSRLPDMDRFRNQLLIVVLFLIFVAAPGAAALTAIPTPEDEMANISPISTLICEQHEPEHPKQIVDTKVFHLHILDHDRFLKDMERQSEWTGDHWPSDCFNVDDPNLNQATT